MQFLVIVFLPYTKCSAYYVSGTNCAASYDERYGSFMYTDRNNLARNTCSGNCQKRYSNVEQRQVTRSCSNRNTCALDETRSCDNKTSCALDEARRTRTSWGLVGYPLASVYSPLQGFENLYDCETALTRGTIFQELDLPFICGGMTRGGNSRG